MKINIMGTTQYLATVTLPQIVTSCFDHEKLETSVEEMLTLKTAYLF